MKPATSKGPNRCRTSLSLAGPAGAVIVALMGTDPILAERLPILYRIALDAIDELARGGERREAAHLRTVAARAYSRAWNEGARRALEDVIRRAGQ